MRTTYINTDYLTTMWCSALNNVLMLIVTFMMCCQLALYKAQQSPPRLELIACAATTGPNSDFSNCFHYYSGSSVPGTRRTRHVTPRASRSPPPRPTSGRPSSHLSGSPNTASGSGRKSSSSTMHKLTASVREKGNSGLRLVNAHRYWYGTSWPALGNVKLFVFLILFYLEWNVSRIVLKVL